MQRCGVGDWDPHSSVSNDWPCLPSQPLGRARLPGSRNDLVPPAPDEADGEPTSPGGWGARCAWPPGPHPEGDLRPPPAPLILLLHSQHRGSARDSGDRVLLTRRPWSAWPDQWRMLAKPSPLCRHKGLMETRHARCRVWVGDHPPRQGGSAHGATGEASPRWALDPFAVHSSLSARLWPR